MSTAYVEFADATDAVVISVFGCQQDPTVYPNQATIDSSDARYQAYINPASTITGAQSAQIVTLTAAYQVAIATDVSYTSKGGVAKTYQADPASVANLQAALLVCQATNPSAPATPTGFYWVASDNTQVPFAYADLQGLAAAMFAQGAAAFQKLQTLKAQVNAATTMAAARAISW
ncbi:DUF4376 domain-containing protein [Paraburkholderia tropica]|uniref:DUF4376 domain-containing protein n=1 Tax=Paraburkholderia tropica TaxID=92647 RepID=UPI003D2B7499